MSRVGRGLLILIGSLLIPACGPGGGGGDPLRVTPAAPTGLSASVASSTRIDLNWTNVTLDQAGVNILRSADDVTYDEIETLSGTAVSYQDQGLFPSSTYYYKVRGVNSGLGGPLSNLASATTLTPAWAPVAPGGTPPTGRVNMGSANGSGKMILSAGDDSSFPPSNTQTWSLSLTGAGSPAWTQIGTGTNPGVRSFPAIAFRSPGTIILFGGLDQSNLVSPVYKNDVWSLNLSAPANWAPVTTIGTPPSPRFGHAVVMNGSKLYVIGGQIEAPPPDNVLNDVWCLDFSLPTPTWSLVLGGGPMAVRAFHAAVLDPVNNQIVVFGGSDGFSYRNDTWALSLSGSPSWHSLSGSTPPSGRISATAVYNDSAKAVLVFGGNGPLDSLNDVWMLSLTGTPAWFPVFVAGTPPGIRGGHAAVFDDATNRMVIFGGQDFSGGTLYGDVWKLQF